MRPNATAATKSLTTPTQVADVPHAGEAANLLRKLDELEEADARQHPLPTGPTRWMLPYADVMTLLFGLFLVLYVGAQQQMAPLQQRYDALTKTHAALKQQLRYQHTEVATLKDTLSAVRQQLDQWQAKTAHAGVHFRKAGNDLVVTLDEQILFAPGQATLNPQSRQTLGQLAGILATTAQPLRIEGHTDTTPIHTAQYPSNWELSTARAMAILRELAMFHHLPAHQLSAAGYGQFRPVADNSTNQGKQKNRRVDIVIMGGQIAPPPLSAVAPVALPMTAVPLTKANPVIPPPLLPPKPQQAPNPPMVKVTPPHGQTR